ncbi:DarT1-associated NADAR antitoxin family protein [Staphylococcus warneri]
MYILLIKKLKKNKKIKVEFTWHSGFSKEQKQKNMISLHQTFLERFSNYKILEVSTKSKVDVGVKASAFNLTIETKKGNTFSVEELFQTSKVYKKNGDQSHLLKDNVDIREIKRKLREINENDEMIRYSCFNQNFPLEPRTLFYNWLYINVLNRNEQLAKEVLKFDAFTDIEFNPKRSYNCQAEACSIYVSLVRRDLLEKALNSVENFKEIVYADV